MAVYTEVSDEDLAQLVARYRLGEVLSCKGIAEGVENTNYLVRASTGGYILTLYERRVAPEDLPFFLGLLEHLANRGVSCPLPVRDPDGRNLTTVAGRPAALVTFLDGVSVKRPRSEHCAAVGRALAELHRAGADFPIARANALGLEGWRTLFSRLETRADEIVPGLQGVIAAELDHLGAVWPAGLPAGVIHADLFPDNVFFMGARLSGLIDFYFACNDALAYDIAVSLNAWCFEADGAFNVTKGRALLRGYQEVRRLGADEREALPVLARGAALRFLLTRAYDWLHTSKDALVRPHDPVPFLRRLRFHQGVRSAASYGLEGVA